LLFTAPPARRIPRQIAGVAITEIGQTIRGHRILVSNPNRAAYELHPRGWEHFK